MNQEIKDELYKEMYDVLLGGEGASNEGSLTIDIKDYISMRSGYFTVKELDNELCLRDRSAKKHRSMVLTRLVREGSLMKDDKDRYVIIRDDYDWINLAETDDDYFDIELPLDLSTHVNLPKNCICVLAGSSNAGKTMFLLDLIARNLTAPYKIIHLLSEMGKSEFKKRIQNMGLSVQDWGKKVRALEIPRGFHIPIMKNNPDGLNVIDYLREEDGEYFRIGGAINDVYKSLNGGMAWIALQKHTSADIGRGGEATEELSRLYLVMDTLATGHDSTICAVKIRKVKDFVDVNPVGYECHVKITRGRSMQKIMDWQRLNRDVRAHKAQGYQKKLDSLASSPMAAIN